MKKKKQLSAKTKALRPKMPKWKPSPPTIIDTFQETLSAFPQVEMRKMFGFNCAFINGNMATGLWQDEWMLRLPPEDRENFLKIKGSKIFAPMGRKSSQTVVFSDSTLASAPERDSWIAKCITYSSSLPAKVKKKK